MARASRIRSDDVSAAARAPRSPSQTRVARATAAAARRSQITDYEARIIAYEDARDASDLRRPRGTPSRPRPRPPSGNGRLGASAHAVPGQAPARLRTRQARRPRTVSQRRLATRRIVALTILVFVASSLISYTKTMLAPSNVSFGVRSVEWLREHGAGWLVNDVEHIYYSLNAPQKGGPPLKSLPNVGDQSGAQVASYAPASIPPVIDPALPGEGLWRSTGMSVNGVAPVLVTTFRADPSYPQIVAGVAWIDSRRTSLTLYPGRYEPPAGSFRGPMEVPPNLRGQLLATFNSGFRLEDSGGAGFAALGHVYAPLRDGLATLVGLRDGSVDVRTWTGGPEPGRDVLFARQNLPLIVENGRLNPRLSDGSEWGATLGNAVRVWRSGVGVDAHRNLLYAAADDQTAESLALILQRAGAVRAMELDINSEWVTFNFYGAPGAGLPSKLLPGMNREATRYLTPDDRDFFAVYSRGGG
jgi:Phosphodiester glycosidase